MSNKNYRTLDGLYKALVPIVNNLVGNYEIVKNDEDVAIFANKHDDEPFGGYAIVHLLPILKRATWMVRRNVLRQRIELLVWISEPVEVREL